MTETSGHKCFLSWFHWLKTSPHYENVTHLQDSSTSVKVAFSHCLAGQCTAVEQYDIFWLSNDYNYRRII